MASLLVTVGTDGSKDWVRTPDGQKYALGPVSVLTLLSRLSRNSKTARHALDEFLARGEVMVSVDDDALWGLLSPVRTRLAAGPFIAPDPRNRSPRGTMIKAAGPKLAFDVYQANLKAARGILEKAQQTAARIERLASAGKRFDAARARGDVARVTTKVASICEQTELVESWVQGDLSRLAAVNDELHALFRPRSQG